MPSLSELHVNPLLSVNSRSVSSRAFRRSLSSVRRAHSPALPCRQLHNHLTRPNSTTWSYRLPLLVLLTAHEQLLDPLHLPQAVFQAWCSGDSYPEAILGQDAWIALFREAGFSQDGAPSNPPISPITVYRGSWRQFCKGLSWTSNWHAAIRYAGDGYSDLYVAHPQPTAVLARITARGDDEWILDTTRLDAERVHPSSAPCRQYPRDNQGT